MLIKFIFYILMKKKEKQEIDIEMLQLLEDNNYTPYKEWKDNVNIQDASNNN